MVRQAVKKEDTAGGEASTTTSSLTVEPGGGGGSSAMTGRAGGGGGRTSSSSGNSSMSSSLRSRIPESLDVFGFSISPGQFVLVQLAATFMLGFHGTLIFLAFLAAYTIFQRVTSDGDFGSSSSSGGPPPNRRFGGGANIRGVSDLPPDPKGG